MLIVKNVFGWVFLMCDSIVYKVEKLELVQLFIRGEWVGKLWFIRKIEDFLKVRMSE